MKGSVLTTKTWFLLIGATLRSVPDCSISVNARDTKRRLGMVSSGSTLKTESWRGASSEGLPPSARGCFPATTDWHHLDGKSRAEEITSARDVQIYLDQARVGGQIHYLMQRPSYSPEIGAYWADLDNLGAIHKWTPRVLYINLIGLAFLFVGFFVLFKQGGRAPFVLHFATLCLAAFVFLFYTPVGAYRDLDLAVAFLDSAALIIFAPLFLHFCSLYPTRQQLFAKSRWRAVFAVFPGVLLLLGRRLFSCSLATFSSISGASGLSQRLPAFPNVCSGSSTGSAFCILVRAGCRALSYCFELSHS